MKTCRARSSIWFRSQSLSVWTRKFSIALDACCLLLGFLLQPGSCLSLLLRDFSVNPLNRIVGQHLGEIRFLEHIRFTCLLDLPQEPLIAQHVEGPELLEPRRRLVASQEFPGAVVHIVVLGRGRDQGCEFPLIGFFRIPDIDQVDIFHLEVFDLVDLVVRNHST